MKLKVLGSGGYLRIPRACCNCRLCKEARNKGAPHQRLGQSLFIKDQDILFDTPEDINTELNVHNIPDVKHLFYSHWHPDHTAGIRILETLRADKNKKPINIYLTESLLEDFKTKVSSVFFFEKQNYCKINIINKEIKIGSISIELIELNNKFVYAFLIKEKNKKVLFCPCHSMYIPVVDKLQDVDYLIINLGTFDSKKLGITRFKEDNLTLIKKLNAKNTVFTHIEECFDKNYDDYCKLEKSYKEYKIRFAYDGMEIIV